MTPYRLFVDQDQAEKNLFNTVMLLSYVVCQSKLSLKFGLSVHLL